MYRRYLLTTSSCFRSLDNGLVISGQTRKFFVSTIGLSDGVEINANAIANFSKYIHLKELYL